jgi:DNA polymerase III delta subunit
MIYLFYGTDAEKSGKYANATVDSSLKKHEDATLIKIGDEEISQGRINELIGAQALFYNKYLVFFHKTFDNKENKELILKNIKELAKSENIFIFAEGKTDKASLTKIEKVAEKVKEFIKPEKALTKKQALAVKGEKIDFFEFADALGRRDKKDLWVLYQDALAEQVPAEEVHGIFFWQIKSMLLAKKCKTPAEANMKPYPFQKAREYARNYKKDSELENLAGKLVFMYHEAHRGNADFYIALEKFILEL